MKFDVDRRQKGKTENGERRKNLVIFAAQFLCHRYNNTIYALGAWGAGAGKYTFQGDKYLSLRKYLCYCLLPTGAHHGRGLLNSNLFYKENECCCS